MMTTYQISIANALKLGSKLQSSEGVNYKTWLTHPNGDIQNIRRDSAEVVCEKKKEYLIFGEVSGIRWKDV